MLVGIPEGAEVGLLMGLPVGARVGLEVVGEALGCPLVTVGDKVVGLLVVGLPVGAPVGPAVG